MAWRVAAGLCCLVLSARIHVVVASANDAIGIGLSGGGQRPLPDKREFVRNYQGNFGSIKVPGCGLFNDSLFDPMLLVKYVNDRPCYEKMMQAHADRGDNRVVVDPRADYHGGQGGGIVDWWTLLTTAEAHSKGANA